MQVDIMDAMRSLNAHQHICLLYKEPQEWLETVPAFLVAGLARNEKCLCIIERSALEPLCKTMSELGISLAVVQDSGQFVFGSANEIFLYNNDFNPVQTIYFLAAQVRKALKEGYQSLRLSIGMNWSHTRNIDMALLTEFEARLNHEFFPRFPCTALCQYDCTRFSSAHSHTIANRHPLMLRKSKIETNTGYLPSKDLLGNRIMSSIA